MEPLLGPFSIPRAPVRFVGTADYVLQLFHIVNMSDSAALALLAPHSSCPQAFACRKQAAHRCQHLVLISDVQEGPCGTDHHHCRSSNLPTGQLEV
jgi:hypothetical protein